jgi:hypothetical protein
MTTESAPPGVSALLDGAGAPAETVTPSREQAYSRLGEMTRSPAFQELLLRNDPAALAELKSIRRQINAPSGLQIMVKPDSTPGARQDVLDTWSRFADLPSDVLEQVRERQPVSESEYKRALALKKQLHSDKDWVTRFFNGNVEARRQSALISIILSSEIAR